MGMESVKYMYGIMKERGIEEECSQYACKMERGVVLFETEDWQMVHIFIHNLYLAVDGKGY